ncbi:bifunctional phosphoribosyl-AMP cyclohydrolase/phosphoribosyl-ATP diphosphatase HisIE [Thermanaeromonas sp. C210]|uniref:bifunctional phosphoribosyl-AMP cyclohydrolase/phosphoribosyl-ATP diphosphatase HisIE n=1 Tax=Thermanaeromonas sp. C210 TaxID=2731925 RepID=UPI00155B4E41|nr:bifunctional phosphoribosyl-AMP cyclohydrolase/phosphoribosyl-ATP diphosphatase HisIE [Thermanaeromonas sp. C210]GFN22217.1 bifunctional phosphoribosyl-AMP cyclohydrolase/phosphoribosyl-ATP diphosphatase [Thermanaeromonas sp. C210]
MEISLPAELKFNQEGLIPAIVQDVETGEVLMLAYMNREALERSLASGQMWFYSRSRQELWHKGATSGHYQHIVSVSYDCDGDALLFKVRQEGVACHEGRFSCFHNPLPRGGDPSVPEPPAKLGAVLEGLFAVIRERQALLPEGSYTAYLFKEGQDKILKKVAEEAGEVIIASKNQSEAEVLYELADLYYHTLVLLAYHGLGPDRLAGELNGRRK